MKIINAALCSFGMSGKVFHAPFIHGNKGFDLYAVWERTQKQAAAIYPGIRSYDTLEEMLADPFIDLVVVNTPVFTHYEYAKRALLARKHVLVEKAFTVTVSEAAELLQIAEIMDKKLSVFQNRRYDSDFKTVQLLTQQAVLGNIVEAEFHFDRFNLQLSPKKHKEEANAGAGILHDLGPHLIDQAILLFGMPISLSASLRILRPGSIVNDYFDILLFYKALTVRLKASFIVKEPPASYCLHGTRGSFLKDRADIQEDVLKQGGYTGAADWGKEPDEGAGMLNILLEGRTERSKIISRQGNYMEFYDRLYDAIANNGMLPVSAEDGIKVMRIIEKVQESASTGKVAFL